MFPPCREGGENNPITLQEAQSWSNGENIKTVLRRVTYLMDPGIERWRGVTVKSMNVEQRGRGYKMWGQRFRWHDIVGVSAEGLLWYPSTLEQTVIETTLNNFCTLQQLLCPSIAHKHATKSSQEHLKKCVTPTLVTSFGKKRLLWKWVFFFFRICHRWLQIVRRGWDGHVRNPPFCRMELCIVGVYN